MAGIRELLTLFISWKLLLLVVACASPGPGYDTSTQILFDQYSRSSNSWLARTIEHVVLRLTRWDGIYFASSSTRGHVNEQDWAFSWVLAKITSAVSRVFLSPLPLTPIVKNALAGVIISHVYHLIAVLLLFNLTFNLIPAKQGTKGRIAFTTACLHIVSPAGLFLSSPYGESTLALFNFMGMLCYVYAVQYRHKDRATAEAAIWTIAAGASFGIATTARSNGLLSGTIFAWDAILAILRPSRNLSSAKGVINFAATIAAGLLVAVGFAAPQCVAYLEYCTGGNTRPWCTKLPPSIYTWVQDHYWQVGLFKYWTSNNLPLILLAAPMLVILLYTSEVALFRPESMLPSTALDRAGVTSEETKVFRHVLPRLALPQLVLAGLAATSFHVQIINRISSGYPVWYMVLAVAVNTTQETVRKETVQQDTAKSADTRENTKDGQEKAAMLFNGKEMQWEVRVMVMYAIIQGGLYASFLPPA